MEGKRVRGHIGEINMAIRSGRFKTFNSTRTIITGRTGTFFRILNSAQYDSSAPTTNQITVTFGTGPSNTAVILPTFSLDFKAAADVVVGGTHVVEGIYDALPNPDIKSGRFRTKFGLDARDHVKIVTPGSGAGEAIYRIFNTGPVPLQLASQHANGTGSPVNFGAQIQENESFDFKTNNNEMVFVKGTGNADEHIQGIYDFISG